MAHAGMRWFVTLLAVAAIMTGVMVARAAGELRLEPFLTPTVNPTLLPTSAIQTPLKISADKTLVWRPELDQKMFLDGNVSIEVGYRVMRAPQAVVWLTPSAESGVRVFDVAIYLSSGDKASVRVEEGTISGSTVSMTNELLVTTRVAQSALLIGQPEPINKETYTKLEKENVAYVRGEQLRQDLLRKPPPMVHIPQMTFTEAELALQRGWIARGPGNILVPGPADAYIVRGPDGNTTRPRQEGGPEMPAKEKPRPQVLVTFAKATGFPINDGKEQVTVVNSPFLLMDKKDGRPALQLRAENGVFFSPPDAAKKAGEAAGAGGLADPAAVAAAAAKGADKKGAPLAGDATKYVTGVYLEGDVQLIFGSTTIQATRLYYDLTSDRAIILDASLSAVDDKRNVPVHMRANEIRQVSQTEFVAKDVKFSTSEFYTPHYHIGASTAYLQQVPLGTGPGVEAAAGLNGNSYDFQMDNATLNVQGQPIFWLPTIAGNTDRQPFPLRKLNLGSSKRYGPTIETSWDLLSMLGQTAPEGTHLNMELDYFGKRGPGGGVDGRYDMDSYYGVFKTYGIFDTGTDKLGRDPARSDLPLEQQFRARLNAKHKQLLDENWTLQLELSYITDPNFLENFFENEFDAEKEQETSVYLKRQGETDALTFLAKFSLYDFTANADLVDDQYTTDKKPEIKYFRIGDSIYDLFTYYSETSFADVHSNITNYSPSFSGLQNLFAQSYFAAYGMDVTKLSSVTIRDFYRKIGWTTDDVLRFDTRHEFDMPLTFGDVKVTPYVMARFTYWDDGFDLNDGGDTTRIFAGGGVRIATQFWQVYENAESLFWDVHRIRHIIEPSLDIMGVGSDQNRNDLQPFDRDVEGISTSSGMNLAIKQKWQTKRGGPGNERTTDWITLDINWSYFWNQDDGGKFFTMPPLRGYYFASRPELSLAANAVNIDASWRVGERVRLLGQGNINTDLGHLQQASAGVAIDQSPYLSYFLGTRYVTGLNTYEIYGENGNYKTNQRGASTSNEITFAIDYQVTRKYKIIFSESYDTELSHNILTSLTLIRRFPRFNGALTLSYDANNSDTSVTVTMWPEGFPEVGFGNTEVRKTR